ncbi:MAG: hypothetical protein LBL09_04700 [Oscillospiraceae bacterium]|jgi:hypothetical protein|nr:hypothetical protein [Oscillospiraceae bacterium]
MTEEMTKKRRKGRLGLAGLIFGLTFFAGLISFVFGPWIIGSMTATFNLKNAELKAMAKEVKANYEIVKRVESEYCITSVQIEVTLKDGCTDEELLEIFEYIKGRIDIETVKKAYSEVGKYKPDGIYGEVSIILFKNGKGLRYEGYHIDKSGAAGTIGELYHWQKV